MTPDTFNVLVTAWLGLLGLVIGSFLNVVIARVPEGLSIVRPRSRCPRCGHVLSWYDNVPVLSWLALRGRCRGCRAPISVRYVLVELLTGGLFVACAVRFGWTWELVLGLSLISLLVPLTFIDAEHWVLPFELTVPGILAGVLLSLPLGAERVELALWGVGVGFLAFRSLEFLGWLLFRKEALGGGDKFLLALLGGFLTVKPLLGVIFLASLQGALFGIARLLLTGRAGPRPAQAAGPEGDVPLSALPSEEAAPTMHWEFLAPGLPWWRRLVLLPVSLLLQPIPDEPPASEEPGQEEVEWTPGVTNLPFGPWLALAGVELLLLGPWLAEWLPPALALLAGGGF